MHCLEDGPAFWAWERTIASRRTMGTQVVVCWRRMSYCIEVESLWHIVVSVDDVRDDVGEAGKPMSNNIGCRGCSGSAIVDKQGRHIFGRKRYQVVSKIDLCRLEVD